MRGITGGSNGMFKNNKQQMPIVFTAFWSEIKRIKTVSMWVHHDYFLTVWQGTVSGLWLGAVAAVCLICLVRCSTQSWRSCWWVHATWRRSNIVPAETHAMALKAWCVNEFHPEYYIFHVTLPLSSKAFLWASQSSSFATVMLARGNFPCRGGNYHIRINKMYLQS